MARDMSPILPEKIIVYFLKRRCSGSMDDDRPGPSPWIEYDWKIEDVQFTDPDVADSGFKGTPGSTLIIHEACQALVDPGVETSNETALEDLVSQIAQDFYDFRSFTADYVYISLYAIEPTALWDYIEFIHDADEPNEDERPEAVEEQLRPRFSTRVITEPWNGEVQELQHMDPDIADCTDEKNDNKPIDPVPCLYYYSGETACISGGGMAEAEVNDDGEIYKITVTKAGKYTSTPKVAISGDGKGAKLTAVLGTGGLTSVTIDDGGEDYTYAIISFYGGGNQLQLTRMMLCLEDGRLVSRFISYDGVSQ